MCDEEDKHCQFTETLMEELNHFAELQTESTATSVIFILELNAMIQTPL